MHISKSLEGKSTGASYWLGGDRRWGGENTGQKNQRGRALFRGFLNGNTAEATQC